MSNEIFDFVESGEGLIALDAQIDELETKMEQAIETGNFLAQADYCSQIFEALEERSEIYNVGATYAEDLENYDPESSDGTDVIGNPKKSMEYWEYQGDTMRCALYTQKFVIEELTGRKIDIEAMVDVAKENGWFDETYGSSIVNTNKMLDYYGIKNEASDGNSIDDIKEALENGKKIIAAVDADEYWKGEKDWFFKPFDGPNHVVEVIGLDESDPNNPMVILNDSGNPDGRGEMVPKDTFKDAWDDSNNYMIVC